MSDAEKAEFDSVKRIGREFSNRIEYTPGRLVVLEQERANYACQKDGESIVRTAYAVASPPPRSNFGANLLTQNLTATLPTTSRRTGSNLSSYTTASICIQEGRAQVIAAA